MLRVRLLTEDATVPRRGSPKSAGLDLFSPRDFYLPGPGGRVLIKLGIAVAIPEGHYGRIAPRSGLAVKSGISVLGGVVDEDYRGEVGVILINHGDSREFRKGEAIAQLILERISIPEVQVVESLDETERGEGGFGSTDPRP